MSESLGVCANPPISNHLADVLCPQKIVSGQVSTQRVQYQLPGARSIDANGLGIDLETGKRPYQRPHWIRKVRVLSGQGDFICCYENPKYSLVMGSLERPPSGVCAGVRACVLHR